MDFNKLSREELRRFVLADMAEEVYTINRDNGWFDADRSVGDGMALLHSEISEAFDAWRKHGFEDQTKVSGKPEGYGSELADVLIRLLDQVYRDGVGLASEYERKAAYNKTRGYRHGGRAV